jgi:hypothetical protein
VRQLIDLTACPAWVCSSNGNTSVSKTEIQGSNPCRPVGNSGVTGAHTRLKPSKYSFESGLFHGWTKGNEEMMNDEKGDNYV